MRRAVAGGAGGGAEGCIRSHKVSGCTRTGASSPTPSTAGQEDKATDPQYEDIGFAVVACNEFGTASNTHIARPSLQPSVHL